jgi:hypothetical protein
LAIAPQPEAAAEGSILAILQSAVSTGVNNENVGGVERMVALYERLQDKKAAKDFSAALADLQAETGKIVAMKPVHGKSLDGGKTEGPIKYHYAPFEDIMDRVRPLLTKHGFSISFDTEIKEPYLTSLCTLTHRSGHSKTNRFTVRMGDGPPHASAAQASGSNASFARRYALCDALAIVISQDDDARVLGRPVDAFSAAKLIERARLTVKENMLPLLWRMAGVLNAEDVPASKLPVIEEYLAKREKEKGITHTPEIATPETPDQSWE